MTLRVRWLGRVPFREALDLHTRFDSATSDHLLRSSTLTSTRSASGLRPSTSSRRRRASVPTSCGSIAAATSRTTGRASSSAIPSSRFRASVACDRHGRHGAASRASSSCSSTRWPSRRRLPPRLRRYPGVWLTQTLMHRARSRRSACVRRGAHDARLRPTSAPTSRCSTHRAVRHRGHGRDVARSRRRRCLDAGGRRRRERARGRTVGS